MNFLEKFSQIFPNNLFISEGQSSRRTDMMNLTVEFRNFGTPLQMSIKFM
jgi:hypothetical protein